MEVHLNIEVHPNIVGTKRGTGKIQLTPLYFFAKMNVNCEYAMTVKLVLLRTGETIISNVSEMVVGDESNRKVIGYSLENPCGIMLESLGDDGDVDLSKSKTKLSVRLLNWAPLSKDKKIPIVCDWVVSLMDPLDDLKETYEQTTLVRDNKNE
jgi:hypothetical protein